MAFYVLLPFSSFIFVLFLKDARHTELDQPHGVDVVVIFFPLATEVVKLIAYPLHIHVLKKITEVGSSGSCQPVIIFIEKSSYISYSQITQ
jgi:hypothetical protein